MSTKPGTPRQIVAAALRDWWTITDPLEPFDADDVAATVETYLAGSGYRIAPDIPPPSRLGIALMTALALACTAGAVLTAAREHWAWALPLVLGALTAGWAATDAHHDRRTHHQDHT